MLTQMQANIADLKSTQSATQTTLTRKERVEALEDDVALLKTAIKAMSQRLEKLEKAGSETA